MITRRPDFTLQMDMHAIGRMLWKGLANGMGTSAGNRLFKKADIHAAEGDKVAAVVATTLMVGGGIIAAIGQQVMVQVLPNISVEAEEEKNGD